MIILEAMLFSILAISLVGATYTDCKSNIIHNKLVLVSSGFALVIDTVYYLFFASDYVQVFIINLVVVVLISFFFYAYHLWAAGDSKLMFLVGLCIPGRFYTFWQIGRIPSFAILIYVFTIAFLYVVVDSIIVGIKEKTLFKLEIHKVDYVRVILSYLSMVAASTLIHAIIQYVWGDFLYNDLTISLAVNFLIVLTLVQLRNRLRNRELLYATIALCTVVVLFKFGIGSAWNTTVDIRSWIIVFVLMFIRMIAERYNYQEIPTCSVKKGHILSASTILQFKASRVAGLPIGMTEDLRSRLSEDEANSVRRWETSRFGKPTVVIVRKIPFAVFIGIGTVIFVLIEVAML